MFCQFHDVAGGVGIQRVHEEAEEKLRAQIEALEKVLHALKKRLALPETTDYTAADGTVTAVDGGFLLTSSVLRVRVDHTGAITSIVDKRSGLPLMNPGQRMNDWRLYENVEVVYNAWELSRDWRRRHLDTDFHPVCTVRGNALHVAYTFGSSTADMTISLNGDRIEIESSVDWHERRKLLKVHFESNVLCEDALHDIQFGHVKRPCHASHAYAAERYESCSNRWTALCEENRGFAILTGSIRGVSTDRGEIALSLLRAPLVPDDTADRGYHHFDYAIMPFATGFKDAGVIKAGYDFAEGGVYAPGFKMDSNAIILETIKPADDGRSPAGSTDDIILRLYESLRTHATGVLHLPFAAKVYESSMDESETGALLGEGGEIRLAMKPFEIRTLRVVR